MNEVVGSKIEMIEIECRQKQIKTYDAVPLFTDKHVQTKTKTEEIAISYDMYVYLKVEKDWDQIKTCDAPAVL